MIAARAVQAGAAAVAENKSRQEREDKLIAASEARAKAEAEVGFRLHNRTFVAVSPVDN